MMDTNILDSITVLQTFCACSFVFISFSVIVGLGLVVAATCSPPDKVGPAGPAPPLFDFLVMETGAVLLIMLFAGVRSALSVLLISGAGTPTVDAETTEAGTRVVDNFIDLTMLTAGACESKPPVGGTIPPSLMMVMPVLLALPILLLVFDDDDDDDDGLATTEAS